MPTPEVGQYWQFPNCPLSRQQHSVGKVKLVAPNSEFCLLQRWDGEIYVSTSRLVKEWKPNWFWRMFGY